MLPFKLRSRLVADDDMRQPLAHEAVFGTGVVVREGSKIVRVRLNNFEQ